MQPSRWRRPHVRVGLVGSWDLDVLHYWAPYFVSYGRAMLAQSSVVILLLLAADVLLRHRVRPAIRYAIWMLALVKLLLPPALSSPTSPAYWLSGRAQHEAALQILR